MKLMSHQDQGRFFQREIILLTNIINKLSDVNEKYMNNVFQSTDAKQFARLEGGNMELARKNFFKAMNHDDISSSVLSTD